MARRAAAVFVKELVDAVRDRRAFLSGLFYAVWGPLVMALALFAVARDRGTAAPLTLAVGGGDRAGSLVAFLEEQSVTVVAGPDDPADAVRRRVLPVAVQVEPAYAEHFTGLKAAEVSLWYDGSWSASVAQAARVRRLLDAYGRRVADQRLVLRGVDPSITRPLVVQDRDQSTAAGRAAAALATLPIFLILAAFVGGMSVASDTMAGERERGSLEALLLHPVPGWVFALGKWAAAVAVNFSTVVLTLVASQLVLRLPRIQAIDLPLGLSTADAARLFMVLAPLALFVPAVQMLVALFARTYKEAQTQLSLLMFVPMVPGFLLAFGSLEASAWMTLTPVLGQHLLVAGVIRGEPPSLGAVAVLAAVTLGFAAAAIGLTASLIGHERIVRGARA